MSGIKQVNISVTHMFCTSTHAHSYSHSHSHSHSLAHKTEQQQQFPTTQNGSEPHSRSTYSSVIRRRIYLTYLRVRVIKFVYGHMYLFIYS